MADALCLTYPQDIASANALLQAKRLYDANYKFTMSQPSQIIEYEVDIGSFTSAIVIPISIPYRTLNCMGGNYATAIIPNMLTRGLPVIYSNTQYVTSNWSDSGYEVKTEMRSTASSAVFVFTRGSYTGITTYNYAFSATIAVLS